MKLSEQLAAELVEGRDPERTETISGRRVFFFVQKWMEDGREYSAWSYEIEGGPRSKGTASIFRVSFDRATKQVANLDKDRDQGGQYKHAGKWDRICKCGHALDRHTAVALPGGIRDCLGCEEEGKDDSSHRFVEKKPKKGAA